MCCIDVLQNGLGFCIHLNCWKASQAGSDLHAEALKLNKCDFQHLSDQLQMLYLPKNNNLNIIIIILQHVSPCKRAEFTGEFSPNFSLKII
jgi:hypothetical protein